MADILLTVTLAVLGVILLICCAGKQSKSVRSSWKSEVPTIDVQGAIGILGKERREKRDAECGREAGTG